MAATTRKMPQVRHLTLEEARRTVEAEGLPFTVHLAHSMTIL
jgi:hypothetical protein